MSLRERREFREFESWTLEGQVVLKIEFAIISGP